MELFWIVTNIRIILVYYQMYYPVKHDFLNQIVRQLPYILPPVTIGIKNTRDK